MKGTMFSGTRIRWVSLVPTIDRRASLPLAGKLEIGISADVPLSNVVGSKKYVLHHVISEERVNDGELYLLTGVSLQLPLIAELFH